MNDTMNELNKKILPDTIKTRISGIYKIINKVNGKYYVGSSNNVRKRFCEHIRRLDLNKHHCNALQKAWNKYGKENFEFLFMEEIPKDNLLLIEQKYLDKAKIEKSLTYNCSFIANHVIWKDGKSLQTGKINPRIGKKHTPETIQKMKETHSKRPLGRKLSDEVKSKISKSMLGKKKSPEMRQKLKDYFSVRRTQKNLLLSVSAS